MRLTQKQRDDIKSAVVSIVGAESRVWLFGSRVHDTQRGGDIDLLIETSKVLPSRVQVLCQLTGRLIMMLGDRKIDILLKDALTPEIPIHKAAMERGLLL